MKDKLKRNKKLIIHFVWVLVGIISMGISVYLIFTVNGNIPTGEGLDKTHWLGFWGGYLSFAGTIILGAITLWQNDKANEMNQKLMNIQEQSQEPIIIVENITHDKLPFPTPLIGFTGKERIYRAEFCLKNTSNNIANNIKIKKLILSHCDVDEMTLLGVRGDSEFSKITSVSLLNKISFDYGYIAPKSEKNIVLQQYLKDGKVWDLFLEKNVFGWYSLDIEISFEEINGKQYEIGYEIISKKCFSNDMIYDDIIKNKITYIKKTPPIGNN